MKSDKEVTDSQDEVSLPVRGAWIEILAFYGGLPVLGSLPVRGAWIEIIAGTASAKGHSGRSP